MAAPGRKKGDGKGRLGGRAAGTPNKANAEIKAAFAKLVSDYMDDTPRQTKKGRLAFSLADDLAQMQPQERAKIITGLAPYIIPRQQALSIEDQTQIEADALTQWLQTAPDDAIDAIAAKVLELQARKQAERTALNS